jgi:hypothetical protein
MIFPHGNKPVSGFGQSCKARKLSLHRSVLSINKQSIFHHGTWGRYTMPLQLAGLDERILDKALEQGEASSWERLLLHTVAEALGDRAG